MPSASGHRANYYDIEQEILDALVRLAKKSRKIYALSIAREAGISERTFYNHYKSYDALILSLENILKDSVKNAGNNTPKDASLNCYFQNILLELEKEAKVLEVFVTMKNTKIIDLLGDIIYPRVLSEWRSKRTINPRIFLPKQKAESYKIFLALATTEIIFWSKNSYPKNKIIPLARTLTWYARRAPGIYTNKTN